MKKAFTGHASALRFTQNTAALLALLLLTASVTACTQTPDDSGDTTDTAPVTEETGMKNGAHSAFPPGSSRRCGVAEK